ncbi:RNA polymerase sigma factor [Lederbergia wuyishanensis]|uniref:RNA polymerase sigma factor n=1 Tax=Lederbergia wuyishanensis TaxID=1347903 RepID=A0ABU0D589_9BACI|nr:RNA polymerase sigma factor [Lederbergia wuyishanensis]MCJ8009617.1 RNA polymerase sigma factor [Lederbergia wuyishanensis]MDQ0343526.1 RNA polymerase sigma-70 factor (ECF subfamily) [Lederbergia wuyishanensis]
MGNHVKVEEWFLQYGDDVYNFLVYYTRSYDVEDIVQEVFLKALKSAEYFEERSNPKTWLLSIARRLVIDRYRKEKRYKLLTFELIRKNVGSRTAEDLVINDETLREIFNYINEMNNAYRNVIVCRLILEYSVQETSEILGWSKSKVSLTYHRALTSLKQMMVKDRDGGMVNG